MGLSNELSSEPGSFSRSTSAPTSVFSQRFEALFPHLEPWVRSLSCSPVVLPGLSARLVHSPPPRWVHQLPPCCKSSLPGCPSPPLLPVWMNVSSLSPWLLDFHTVGFSVSSGCFLFLNCCPSFGCVRRHSVSTYASILVGSL